MLNEETLPSALASEAQAAGLPPADLLQLVRRRAARQQHRKAAALGFSGVVAAGVAVTGVVALSGSHHTTVLKAAAGGPTVTPTATADPLCATPTGTPPPRYLDWPCATPADATTPSIVAKLAESIHALHPGIKDPRVRLLADTRGITDPADGRSATLIEEWDAVGSGPAVVAYGDGSGDDESGYANAGDPAMLHGDFSTDDGVQDVVLFARADIASVSLEHDGTVTTVPFTGGAAAISVKAGDISIQHPTYNYVGKTAAGTAMTTISYDSIFLSTGSGADPCAGEVSGTCSSPGTGTSTGVDGNEPTEAPVYSPGPHGAVPLPAGSLPPVLASTQPPTEAPLASPTP